MAGRYEERHRELREADGNHVYFVSYAHRQGFANAEVSSVPIDSILDVNRLADVIARRRGEDSVVVLHFQLLRVEEAALDEEAARNAL